MPTRLQEFLKRNDERLDQVRPLLIEAIEAPGGNRSFTAPIALVGPLNDAMKDIRLGKVGEAQRELSKSIEELKAQRRQNQDFQDRSRKQLVAAHIMHGVVLASQAGFDGRTKGAVNDRDAVNQFTMALDLDKDDLEARLYRGMQYMRLGNLDAAGADFTEIIARTEGIQSLTRARALYARARISSISPKFFSFRFRFVRARADLNPRSIG